LTALRRKLIWPPSSSRSLRSASARQGDGIIVTWHYETGSYNMLLNPTGERVDMEVSLREPAASTGRFEFHDAGYGPGRGRRWCGAARTGPPPLADRRRSTDAELPLRSADRQMQRCNAANALAFFAANVGNHPPSPP